MTSFIIHLQAKRPVTKALIKPTVKGIRVVVSVLILPPSTSSAIFPKISGTTIKNEKRAARSLSIPKRTEVEMVAPDREIPGKIAGLSQANNKCIGVRKVLLCPLGPIRQK